MADNYLEKQQEEYLAHKLGETLRKKQNKKSSHRQLRVFVTGGASGIGKAIVQAFSAENYKVAFVDIDNQAGLTTAKATGAWFQQVDVSNARQLEEAMQSVINEWKDLDVIINNVGLSRFNDITTTTIDEFDHIIDVNLRTVFITSRFLAVHRKSQSRPPHPGRIINLCSTRYMMSESGSEAYAASKGGIRSITHALAISLAPYKITVNCISPGWIQNENYESLRPEDHQQHPSGRVGMPQDIARLCIFLAQDSNDFINGENITVDGGMTRKMIYLE